MLLCTTNEKNRLVAADVLVELGTITVVVVVAGGNVVQQFCFEIGVFVDNLYFDFVEFVELLVTVAPILIAVAVSAATAADVFVLAVHSYVLLQPVTVHPFVLEQL